LLEGEGAGAAGHEAGGHLRRLDDEGARAAHGIDDGLRAGKSALAQEQRREVLPHRRLAYGLLEAAPVQQVARGVDTDGAEVVLDAHPDGERGVGGGGKSECALDGVRDPLRRGARVIDARARARGLDAERPVGAEDLAPRQRARTPLEVGELRGAEAGDAGDDAARAADHQVGAPDVMPAALDGDAAGNGLGCAEAVGFGLVAEHGLQARSRRQEDLEVAAFRHGASISGSEAAFDTFSRRGPRAGHLRHTTRLERERPCAGGPRAIT
jgi:hypothetical protein